MTVLKIFLFIFLNFIVTFAKISDKRLCYNSDCSEPVSYAKTLLRYSSDDSRILSFVPNEKVIIYSKSAGSRLDLWGAEINGKRGYVPIKYVRESKILFETLAELVDTEGEEDPAISSTPKTVTETIPVDKTEKKPPKLLEQKEAPVEKEISPNTVTPSYEVIDGTTLYLSDPPDYSSTPNSIDNNLVQLSEKDLTEQVTEATLPVEPDTKLVIENLNPEIKSDYTNVEEVNNEKKYDLSQEQNVENTSNGSNENESVNIESKEEHEQEANRYKQNLENTSNGLNTNENINVESKEENKQEANSVEEVVENIKSTDVSATNLKNESAEINDDDDDGEDEEEIEDGAEEDVEEEEEEEEEVLPENSEKPVKDDFSNIQSNNNENIQNDENKVVTSENLDVKTSKIVTESTEVHSNFDNESFILEQQSSANVNNILENNSPVESTAHYTEQLNDNIKNSDTVTEANQFKIVHNESVATIENYSANVSDAIKAEESVENLSVDANVEPALNDGVPSHYPNPLNLFSSQEVKDEPIVETNTQVPEFSTNEYKSNPTTNSIASEPDVKFGSVIQHDPFEVLIETYTENPNELNQNQNNILLNDKTPEFIDIQRDSSIKQSELLKDINSDFSFESKDIEFAKNYDSLEYSQNNIGIGSVEEINSNSAKDPTNENNQNIENLQNSSENTSDEAGFFSNIFSNLFGSVDSKPNPNSKDEINNKIDSSEHLETINNEEIKDIWQSHSHSHIEENPADKYLSTEQSDMQSCKAGQDTPCPFAQNYIRSENGDISWSYEIPDNAVTILLYLTLTAITVLLFSLGYYYIEKRRKDGKLIANINELEKKLLITTKECQLAQNELKSTKEQLEVVEGTSCGSNEIVKTLQERLESAQNTRLELEEQIASLENELENATETGMEMSEMLNELLASQTGSEHLMKTINGLQKQVNDQNVTLNHIQLKLSDKHTENELLQTELQVTNEKVSHLQGELDKMVVSILSVQEEKSKIETDYEMQIAQLTAAHESVSAQLSGELATLHEQIARFNCTIEETKRALDLKSNEYDLLKQSMKEIDGVLTNKDTMKALLDVSHVKAEVLQLREEKHKLSDKLLKEIDAKLLNEKQVQVMLQEVNILKDKFDEAEKEKVEAETRLEVLSSYFKEREAQFQKEINENETKWMQKEGEATSTIERIKWIQEELQNYKSQNELLKKEILDQEVSLKSQISMLEKKSHENWLLTRQAERRLEESKQEASQLRNRLTIVEKNLNNSSQMNEETMLQNQSNGDVTNPENPASPPLLFPHRDHMTTSPPLPGLPPFMPPPPGVPFMPPPLAGVPPFMPPPPSLFPGDHRPPPLGRMSSPPLHGRYSPDSRTYSPYDRDDSPPLSPTYADNDYRRRTPPPPVNHLPPRNYSPYSGKQRYWDDKMEYRGQHQHRNKSRPHKGLSSGSGNSNESLENTGRHSGRV